MRSHGAGPRPPPRGWSVGRAPWQPRCSPEKLRSPEGSSAAGTCLAGSPRPAGWAGASAGEGAGPAVLAWHPAESCRTKHKHSITGQLWASPAPSPATVDAWTHTQSTHTSQNTPRHQPRAAMLCPSPGAVGLSWLGCTGQRMGGMSRTLVLQPGKRCRCLQPAQPAGRRDNGQQ